MKSTSKNNRGNLHPRNVRREMGIGPRNTNSYVLQKSLPFF